MIKISSIKKIWDRGAHNAFTDLIRFKEQLVCCFREAGDHVSQDGVIRLLYFGKNKLFTSHTTLSLPFCDLRDPKLSISPNGALIVLAYGRFTEKSHSGAYTSPIVWIAKDGKTFGSPKYLGDKYWWLWRIRWHKNEKVCSAHKPIVSSYGFAYNRQSETLRLYRGDPMRTFEVWQNEALSKSKHHLGYPNESDILFSDNTAYALVRRDADTCTAQLGFASYPFKQWQWHDLKVYIGGPVMCWKDDKTIIVAGRIWYKRTFKTALLSLDTRAKKLRLETILPSGGDCSYPGIVKEHNRLFLSYYSSHEDNKSCIYLAELEMQSETYI